jgi:hypothetical protein
MVRPPRPATPDRKPASLGGIPRIERFRAMTRELACDEDPAAFKAALREIATAGPSAKYEPKKRTPKTRPP